MSLFTTSISVIKQPGVFLIEVAAPTVIDGVPNGYVGIAGQGEWGPVNALYIPTSGADMLNTYFPPGTPHNSTLYYAMMRRKQVPWAVNRILGGTAGLSPPEDITFVVTGTPGATTYRYTVTALNANGESMASHEVIITTGNATLSGSNHNDLSWPAVTGATGYSVYRTVGGATQGKIATNQPGLTLNDTGLAASGSSPASNASGYAPSICNILDSAGVAVLRLTGKHAGTLLNSASRATAVVSAATDGVANHFKLTVTITDSVTGLTSEVYDNLQTIATAILPDLTTSILITSASLVNTPSTRPLNGTYTFYNGSNGAAVTASDYNNAFTNLGTNAQIRFVGIDDCGDSIRAATNANLMAHVDAKGERMAGIQGNPSNALAAAITDVASYRDDRVIYCTWVTVNDDAGTPQQSPFWSFVASAIANLEPQQSHAWWDDRVTTFYKGIASIPTTINTSDDGARDQCTQAGICLPIRLDSGAYAALHDRTTNLAVNRRFAVTRRIKDYLALSIRAGIPGFVNGPNTIDQQRALRNSIDDFLGREVVRGRLVTPPASAAVPNPVPYNIDAKSQNTASSVAAGQFILVISGTTPAPMEQIILMLNVGNTVVVSAL